MKNLFLTCYVGIFAFIGPTSDFNGFASISNVQNLKTDSVAKTSATFSWDEPQTGNPEYYNIYRSTNQYSDFSVIETTSSIFYTDQNLLSSTEYFYKLTLILDWTSQQKAFRRV